MTADLRPRLDLALCPGQDVTRDEPGVEAARCPVRTTCRRYLRPPAGPTQNYLLPTVLGPACRDYDPL